MHHSWLWFSFCALCVSRLRFFLGDCCGFGDVREFCRMYGRIDESGLMYMERTGRVWIAWFSLEFEAEVLIKSHYIGFSSS